MTAFTGAPRSAPTRVLVTDGDSRTALACARSLVAAGHDVWTAGERRLTLSGVSRGVHAARVFASALDDPATFAWEVSLLARQHRIDVLLPVSDASVDALLLHRDNLPPHVALPLPPREVFRAGTDKAGMMEMARAAGFAVPASALIERAEDLDALMAHAVFPAILKPHRSVVTDASGRGHKLDVEYIANADALREAVRRLPTDAFPAMLQERIRGRGEGLFALRWNGETVASFAHRRLREKPPAGGLSVYRESIVADDALVTRTDALLGALAWQGVAMVECKVDRDTGQHVFMELNGRLWGSLQLAIDAGVDFPALLVACATTGATTPQRAYKAGVRSRWWWGDIDHLYSRLAKSATRLHLEAPFPSRARVLRDFLRLPSRDERAEVERWADPLPGVLEAARRLLPALPWTLARAGRADARARLQGAEPHDAPRPERALARAPATAARRPRVRAR
ncbi:MAG: carboxylate--amine ligase [Gemmatimonadaceae bacterium]